MAEEPRVLIVEDEPDLAELYAMWLGAECSVSTAYDGASALEAIDETVDVVLLDRRMPGLSGDEVLDTIRRDNLSCRVAMVTAVEPDFDIIDQLMLRSTYDEQLQRFFALASKKALLDTEKTQAERQASAEYARLEDELAVLRTAVDDTIQELLDSGAYRRVCKDITRERLIE